MVFEFTSQGPKGAIPKIVKFSETNLKDLYNLAFGDKDSDTGDLNDLSISNNGIVKKYWQVLWLQFMHLQTSILMD